MTRLFSYSFALFGFFVLMTAVGCGPAGHTVQSVTGTITYNGQPVEGATVTFVSTDALGHGAVGITDSDGTYVLQTHAAPRPGAVLGDYNVFVIKTVSVDAHGKEYLDDSQPLGPSGRPVDKHLLPAKYSGMDGVPPIFSATVQRGNNVIDFNLED
jgi:hypothetical protein